VEINYTYYHPPSAGTLQRLVQQTGPGFRFCLKALKEMTLGRSQDRALYAAYQAALDPIDERGQLACVLLQFPNAFRLARESVDHLRFIRDQWPKLPLVVEFRHESWVQDERTWRFLRDHSLAFCCVDEPRLAGLMPPVVQCTASPAYVRFHGRNAAKWYHHQEAWERYDYLYNEAELREWLQPVRDLAAQAGDTYLFFNNHYQASAVKNAQQFVELLGAG
jgi:uncharacterized protein YecE (DUF72 family)